MTFVFECKYDLTTAYYPLHGHHG